MSGHPVFYIYAAAAASSNTSTHFSIAATFNLS